MGTAQRAGYLTTPGTVTDEMIAAYQRDGFIKIRGVLTPEEAAEFRAAALAAQQRLRERAHSDTAIFTQLVNVWREDDAMCRLTLHPNVAGIAERLATVPLRLWHDQTLIKRAGTGSAATEFHQDLPYWPHAGSAQPLSAWIALGDVPAERGCMTFLPGSQRRAGLAAQDLSDEHDLFRKAPDLAWFPRVTLPLQAGDCTFHHALCAHMATPNRTSEARVAHVIIYTDAVTTFTGAPHPVTDGVGLTPGHPLDGDLFPRLPLQR
jgi:ectoine hydroxylase-related dioxygenase (phytanoyl-CoA dioxygenase family)